MGLQGGERWPVTLILDVKTRWNSVVLMLERAYRLRNYTSRWLAIPEHEEFRYLDTTEMEW